MTKKYSIGIKAGYFASFDHDRPKIENDIFLGINNDKITCIEKFNAINHSPHSCENFIDAHDSAVIPGLINSHCHLPMTLLRGIADEANFHDWIYNFILPAESQFVSPEFVRLGSELACLELIRFGVTSVSDMYYYQVEAAKAVDHSGMRGVLFQAIADFPAPDNKKQDGNDFRLLDELIEYCKNHPRLTAGVGPHAPYTCNDQTLKKSKSISEKFSLPLQIHVAETAREVKEHVSQHGKTPADRLHQLGVSGESVSYAHSVHLSQNDIQLLKKSKTSVIHNPESNMKLHSGIAPISEFILNDINLGIGTDGTASNNNLNLFVEMDTAVKLQKLNIGDASKLTPEKALLMGTAGSAQALGLKNTGQLKVGNLADIVIINLNEPNLVPIYDLFSVLVHSMSGHEVTTTICNGKILYQNGNYLTLDKDRILNDSRKMGVQIQNYITNRNTKK